MSLTESNMLDLGIQAPSFTLPDVVSKKDVSFEELTGTVGTMIMFICNHCPFVLHVNDALIKLANDYKEKGIGFIAISSNDVENYPQDSPEKMKILAEELGYPFPYLYDETQEVAKAYDAACTPDFYVVDKDAILVYRGRMDASRPGNEIENNGEDIRNVLDAIVAGNPITEQQYPSAGCNIKWKTKV